MKRKIKLCLICLTKNRVDSKVCSNCGQDFKKNSKHSLRRMLKNWFLSSIYPDKSFRT
jgi:hypothetical protein